MPREWTATNSCASANEWSPCGPYGAGEWFSDDAAVALGHRPPWIIDLAEAVAEPTATPGKKLKGLDNVGGRMIGVIVNKYSQIGHYGYYKYYRYYHYQSSYYQQGAGAQVLTSGDEHGEKPVGRDDG